MERLTVHWNDLTYDTFDPIDLAEDEYSRVNFEKVLMKLGEYEDLEEQGLLLKLPCKVGDTVYTTNYYYDCDYADDCIEIDNYKCEEDIRCEHQYKKYFVGETKFQIQMIAVLGKTVFLTKEEAEAKLKEMEK